MPQKHLSDFDPTLKKQPKQTKKRQSQFKSGTIEADVNLHQTASEEEQCLKCAESGSKGYERGDLFCWHIERIIYNRIHHPEEKWVCDDFRPPDPCETCEEPCPGEDQCQVIQAYWQQWERKGD